MAARSKGDVDRWLMKQRSKTTTTAASSTSTSPNSSPGKKGRLINRLGAEVESRQKRMLQAQQAKHFRDSHEDLDFDEVFDDDDEGNDLIPDADEEGNQMGKSSTKSPLKKSTYKLSTEGRQMKRIVKHLDKDNDIIYASDDEMDPYASDNDDEDEGEDNLEQYKASTTTTKVSDEGNFDKLVDSVMTAKSRSTTPATSRATSPAGSPQKVVMNKKVKQDTPSPSPSQSLQNDDLITEAQLIAFLRQGALSTKDLIAKFKRQLKADPKNKEIFRELVRKVAMVKGSGGEEDKLLELKPEYR